MTVTKVQLLKAMQEMHKRFDRIECILEEANAEAREDQKRLRALAQTLVERAKG